jgi:hypothetical protein
MYDNILSLTNVHLKLVGHWCFMNYGSIPVRGAKTIRCENLALYIGDCESLMAWMTTLNYISLLDIITHVKVLKVQFNYRHGEITFF